MVSVPIQILKENFLIQMINNIGLRKQRHRPHIPSSEMKHTILVNLDVNFSIGFAYQ